jgi:hypothetical protein
VDGFWVAFDALFGAIPAVGSNTVWLQLKAGKNCRLHNDLTCAFNAAMSRKRRM